MNFLDGDWAQESVEHFRGLLRLDTTNLPGNEALAAEYIADVLREDGMEPTIIDGAPTRSNLIARLPANVKNPKPPILLTGHTDVVPANPDEWTHPPFEAVEDDGWIYGRGAVDMKNMVTMSFMVLKALARLDEPRERDIIFAAVADEEEGCTYGSKYLVDNHPELVQAEYALGEIGGFWQTINEKTYLPIMVAEKGSVHLRLRARGPAGHGSIPHPENALVRVSAAIQKLGSTRLRFQVTPVMRRFIQTLAQTQAAPAKYALAGMLRKRLKNVVIDRLLPDESLSRVFASLLHDTVSPTMVQASKKRNVIPDEAICDLDGRILPGSSAEKLREQVIEVIADPMVEVEIVSASNPVMLDQVESPLFDEIVRTFDDLDSSLIPLPNLIPGFTDAQHFSRLGIRFYGCSPLRIPPDSGVKFADLFHGVDERVHKDGYLWGQEALFRLVRNFVRAQE